MSILNVEHLTHGFGDRAIFEDVSFRLLKGEHIGLVGANGEGKSTFMSIVTGKLMPDEGKVEWAKNVHAGYLDQHAVLEKGMTIGQVLKSAFDPLLKKEERMNEICDKLGTADPDEMDGLMEELGTIQDELTLHDFYAIDAKVEEVARALGLLDLGLDRDVTDLSGGQRTKVLLAKLLLEKPDILLLDEPTNYLDEEHIAWLKRYLLDYENAFILISHDIPFLNSVVNIIFHMENQELNRYVGDYDHFQEVYAVKKAQLEAAYRKQQQEISELKDFVARNKARVSTRNMAMSRQKKLDKMDVIELAAEKPKPEFKFRYGRTPGKMLFETHDLVIGYDEPLSKPLNFTMERGQKIALVGTNGIGKTTLLRSLLGLIKPLSGSVEQGENLEIGYFEQETEVPEDLTQSGTGENGNAKTVWLRKYGLKAFSPIAKNFPYSDFDDFGASRSYGFKRKHLGHDMMGQVGTPIIAVESGYVEALGWNQYGGWRIGIRSFDKKRYYYYAHLRKNYPFQSNLKEGSAVQAGDVIGYMGRTGYSSKENTNNVEESHLHFGLELVFDESQKESDHEIWINCYELVKFLRRNQCEAVKVEGTKEWRRVYQTKDVPTA